MVISTLLHKGRSRLQPTQACHTLVLLNPPALAGGGLVPFTPILSTTGACACPRKGVAPSTRPASGCPARGASPSRSRYSLGRCRSLTFAVLLFVSIRLGA
jgi:hypothetical protein